MAGQPKTRARKAAQKALETPRESKTEPPLLTPQSITVHQTKAQGRPLTIPTPEITREICERIAMDEPLAQILRDPGMPTFDTVYRWMLNLDNTHEFENFRECYSRAREAQPEATYERLIQLEQDTLNKVVDPNTARVVLLSMQWRMGKMKPKKYGDIRQIDVSGGIDLTVSPAAKARPLLDRRPVKELPQSTGKG